MWWDAATAAGAPDAEDIAKLIWPPRDKPGFLGDGPIEIIQGREKVQLEARQYSSLPANVYMQLKPTLLRLWRLATVKHLGSDYDPSLIRVIHRLQETGELKECVQLVSRLAKCFWAIGVLEQDMGFPELIRVLEAEVPK
ncbi:hypothetical protein CALVIDRAFT_535353 [Calocera viscosa TUFC12733]|uniref:Uncharacterized protein n=1 Tax=Calocera viscosa (strain TUFC12733) TaxID=1330018 RepID=A0A167NZS2_CALVF|nr:hypothetical protein CALVIDRAFT_535353 [Calocera viscosa TUFC12733]